MTDVLRYAAFATTPDGGNPAGVVLDAAGMDDARMQAIAAEVGYSETAFLLDDPHGATGEPLRIRYFAPEGEVPFCGHATVATAAALAEHVAPGTRELSTPVGPVDIRGEAVDGLGSGRFDSVPVGCQELDDEGLELLLRLLGWERDELHPELAPGIGTAGNHHPVLVARDVSRLARLDYDFESLQRLCRERGWITVQLVAPLEVADAAGVDPTGADPESVGSTRPAGPMRWRSRNPFPYGGVVEDPATGSAAAAFCGYLRERGALVEGDGFTVEQGVEMGRPSRIEVQLVDGRARVGGPAVPIP